MKGWTFKKKVASCEVCVCGGGTWFKEAYNSKTKLFLENGYGGMQRSTIAKANRFL